MKENVESCRMKENVYNKTGRIYIYIEINAFARFEVLKCRLQGKLNRLREMGDSNRTQIRKQQVARSITGRATFPEHPSRFRFA